MVVSSSLFPILSKGASLLYATGDSEFMYRLRKSASKQGLLLDEFGLWRWKGSTRSGEEQEEPKGYWELLASKTEEEVMEELGLKFIPPEQRNYLHINGSTKR